MPQRYDPIHDVLINDDVKPEDDTTKDTTEKKEETTEVKPAEPLAPVVGTKPAEPLEPAVTQPVPVAEAAPIQGTPVAEEKPQEPQAQDGSQDTEEEDIELVSEPTQTSETKLDTTESTEPSEVSEEPNDKKHKLSGSSPSKVPLKKLKKQGNKSATVLSSARSRHLKKDDGRPFLRKDIQYEFLKLLFENETRAFRDPYEDSKDRVVTEPFSPHKLTFAELYIKTIAHSSKCSKILRDRLLNDMNMSIPTSMICLLVNVGRMNTTINFVPDMKSQLRTYHSIPCLQVDYDASENKFANSGNGGDKQLQDTPRLKSILKACCDDTDEPNSLNLLNNVEKLPKTSVINIIFLLCNAEESINKTYLHRAGYGFFDIFMNSEYGPQSRVDLFLWLIYAFLETKLSSEELKENPFGESPPELLKTDEDYDIETAQEVEFGDRLYDQRVKFLAEDGNEAGAGEENSGNAHSKKSNEKTEKKNEKKSATDTPIKATPKTEKATPASKQSGSQASKAQSAKQAAKTASQQNTATSAFVFPALPKNDIDVEKVQKSLKYLSRIFHKKRERMGQVKYEHRNLLIEEKLDDDAEQSAQQVTATPSSGPGSANANRMRLKNYKGDYGENSEKFYKLFNLLKNDFVEMAKADETSPVAVTIDYKNTDSDLTLNKFELDLGI